MEHRQPRRTGKEKNRKGIDGAARTETVRGSTSLHLSQQIFWFCASVSLVIGTIIFSIQVLRGHAAAIKFMGIEITSAKAEASIMAARDRLLTIRTKLSDAADATTEVTAMDEVLPEFDDVLKALGVAEAAIKRREVFGSMPFSDYGTYTNPNDGMHDDQGFNWGGDATTSAPKQTPSANSRPPTKSSSNPVREPAALPSPKP